VLLSWGFGGGAVRHVLVCLIREILLQAVVERMLYPVSGAATMRTWGIEWRQQGWSYPCGMHCVGLAYQHPTLPDVLECASVLERGYVEV
jgi:hypothetical protein